ncbi:6-bladed beta-propeller [Candidatus Fermentibacteria bacterium]|nr:6-bladed beta-propeller [Candidatus Fermentibacteria bacterium]
MAILILIVALLAISCGEFDRSSQSSPTAPPDTFELCSVDTIGVGMGDSSYVFGTVMQASAGPEGTTYVLDMQRCLLSVFDEQGEIVRTLGGKGGGPGELQLPMDFALLSDGGVAVNDLQASRIFLYDAQGNYRDAIEGFFPVPPVSIAGGDDGRIVGQWHCMSTGEGQFSMREEICRWGTESSEPLSVIRSMDIEVEMTSEGPRIGRGDQLVFDASDNGDVFVAVVSPETYLVEGFDSGGQRFLTIERPWERVPKTEEEMSRTGMGISVSRDNEGTTAETHPVENPVPWRNAIESIGVDGQDRIWVRLGSVPTPTFEVYDRSGEMLFVARAPALPQGCEIAVNEYGIVAFERNPEDHPKVVRLELSE